MMTEKIQNIKTHKKEILHTLKQMISDLDSFQERFSSDQDQETIDYEVFEIQAELFADHAKAFNRLNALEKKYGIQEAKSFEGIEIAGQSEPLSWSEESRDPAPTPEIKENIDPSPENTNSEVEAKSAPSPSIHFTPPSESLTPVAEKKEEVMEAIPVEVPVQSSFEAPVQPPVEIPVKEEQAREVSKQVIVEEKEVVLPPPVAVSNPTAAESPNPPASTIEERPLSLNDRMRALRKEQLGESGGTALPKRVTDIKSIINLNDKLLFIKDLFNGYSLAYSEAIELLNRYESYEDALAFLQNNYADKNNWAAKPDTVEKLKAIIKKKFL